MSYRTDRQRVRGLGTAHEGTSHWWSQRLTSLALVPLTFFFLFPFARALGSDWETVIELYSTPLHAIMAILFLAVGFRHLQQGLQVVIEDYVHREGVRVASLAALTLVAVALAVACIVAVLKVMLGS